MSSSRPYLLAALLLASTPALAVLDCELNGESVNPANGYTTANKTGIMRCRDRDTGQLQREEELRKGESVGLMRFYKDGRLEKEFNRNEKGNREGRSREFSTVTGKVIRDETARNGTVVGIARTFHPDGQRRRVGFRDDAGKELAAVEYTQGGQLRDLRCSDQPRLGQEADEAALCGFGTLGKPSVTSLHGEKGELRGRVSHLGGIRVGEESYWDNGKLRAQQEIAADGSQVERSFSRDGVKRQEVRWVKGDRGQQKEYEQEFHERGALVMERRWKAGELASEKSFFLNGQPRSEMLYVKQGGALVKESKEFFDNGKLAFQGSYAAERRSTQHPLGEHRRYDNNGRLKQVRRYDAGGRLTREQEFDDAGQMTRDDEVFEDGSRKAFGVSRGRSP